MDDNTMDRGLELMLAVEAMGKALSGSDYALGHLTCGEFEPIAEVLVLAGHDDLAASVLIGHGAGDNEEDDRHHDLYDSGDDQDEIAQAHVRRIKADYGL
jgi:hypothetical protein